MFRHQQGPVPAGYLGHDLTGSRAVLGSRRSFIGGGTETQRILPAGAQAHLQVRAFIHSARPSRAGGPAQDLAQAGLPLHSTSPVAPCLLLHSTTSEIFPEWIFHATPDLSHLQEAQKAVPSWPQPVCCLWLRPRPPLSDPGPLCHALLQAFTMVPSPFPSPSGTSPCGPSPRRPVPSPRPLGLPLWAFGHPWHPETPSTAELDHINEFSVRLCLSPDQQPLTAHAKADSSLY